jgi:hypothetical protein
MKRFLTAAAVVLGAAPLFGQTFFGPRIDMGVTGAACSAILDANSDGRPDIAVCGNGAVYLLLQNAASPGTFAAPVALSVGTGNFVVSIGVADFNRDGKADIIVATNNGARAQFGSILLFAGNGDGTFQAPSTVATNKVWGTIIVTDFNGDGKADFVVGQGSDANIYVGDGTGNFSPAATLFTGSSLPTPLAVADFNNDGKADVAMDRKIFWGNGDGTAGNHLTGLAFGPNFTLDLTSVYLYEQAGDFNSDGRKDLALALNETGAIALGNGDGSFQPSVKSSLLVASPVGLGIADFNFDGHPDLVELLSGTPGSINIVLGAGGGSFQPTAVPVPSCAAVSSIDAPNGITVGDLNGDGAPDVIASCEASNTVSIFLSVAPSVFLQTSVSPATPGQNVGLTAVVGAPSRGFLYVSGFSVQLYDGPTPLGAPIQVSNGLATRTISTLAQSIHYLTAALLNPQGGVVATSGVVTEVISPASCSPNVTAQLNIAPGGFRRNAVTGQYVQTVTVTNTSNATIPGPLSLALGSLTPGVTALNTNGVSVCAAPSAPFVDTGVCPAGLAPGQSVSATLTFSNPSNKSIGYTPVALAGFAPR